MQTPRNLIVALGVLSFLAAGVAHAQLSAVPDPVQYTVTPDTPGPGEQVTISAQAVGTLIGDSTITWTQDGKTALSGVGAGNFSFTVGALGSQTHIQVRISSASQGTLTHDFYFSPSLVNLIWEADTTAPPLYRGKSLYSAGSDLKVVAFPIAYSGGVRISTNNLSMQWSYDGNLIPQQSGLGRTAFSFTGDQLQQQEDVSVDVYYGAAKVGHGDISIPASQPQLLLYVKDALRGTLYDSALPAAISLAAPEITVQAAPYFFANSSLNNGSLLYSWTLNGQDTTGPQSAQGVLTLRQTGSGQGAAALGVALQNTDSDKYVQDANAALQLVFGQSSSGSASGL